MALRQVFVQYQSNVSSLVSAFNQASMGAERAAVSFGKVAGLLGVGMLGSIAAVTSSAMNFQTQLAGIATVSDETAGHIEQIGKQLLSLSQSIPVATGDLARAFSDAERAGFSGAAAMNLVTQSAKSAVIAARGGVAGAEDVTKIIRTLTGVLNDYGLGANEATHVQEVLNVAFKHSSGTYQQLADSIRTAAPIAAEAGLKFTDVAGALATMAKNGLDAGQGGMVLNRIILQMLRPTGEMNDAVKRLTDSTHQHGFETAGAAIQTLGFSNVVKGLIDQVGGSVDKFAILNPSIRSARGALTLFANDGKDFNDIMKEMNDSTQLSIDSAKEYENASKSMANQVKLMKNDFNAASVALGQTFIPVATFIIERIGGMAIQFSNLSTPMKTIIGIGFGLVAVFLALEGASLVLYPALEAVAGALVSTAAGATALELAAGPVGWIMAGLAVTLGILTGASFLNAKATFEQKQRVDELTQAFKAEAEGQTGAINTSVAARLAHDKLFESFTKLGVSEKDLIDLTEQGKDATGAYGTALDSFASKLGFTSDRFKDLPLLLQTNLMNDLKGALDGSSKSLDNLAGDLDQASQILYGPLAGGIDKNLTALSRLNAEQRAFSKTQKDAQDNAAVNNKLLTENTIHLLEYGSAAGEAGSEIAKLNDDQKKLQTSLKNFVDAEAEFKAAQDGLSKTAGSFISVNQIASEAISESQQALTADARQNSIDYRQDLKDNTRAAQDQARDIARANSDMLAEVRQQNEAGRNTVSAPIAGFQVGRSTDESQLLAQKATSDRQARINDLRQKATEENRIAQDNARDVSRQNADLASSYTTSREKAVLSLDTFLAKAQEDAKKNKAWNDDLNKIAEEGGQSFADTLRKMGEDGVKLVSQIASNIKSDAIPKLKEAFAQLDPTTDVSFDAFFGGIVKQNKAAQKWKENLAYLAEHSMMSLEQKFIELGPKAAETLADTVAQMRTGHVDKVKEANEEAAKSFDMVTDAAVQTADEQFRILDKIGQQIALTGNKNAAEALQSIMQALEPGLPRDAVDRMQQNLFKQLHMDLDIPVTVVPTLDENAAIAAGIDRSLFDPSKLPDDRPAVADHLDRIRQNQAPSGVNTFAPTAGGPYRGAPAARFHAYGGIEDHQAQIAEPSTRIWAEPETGGEAYIPLHPSKRGRSEAILGEVASMFGYNMEKYASGGFHLNDAFTDNIVKGTRTAITNTLQRVKWLWQHGPNMNMAGGAGGTMPPPGNVPGNVVSWLLEAMALTGVPADWLPGLETIAMHESGGNPHNANRTAAGIAAGSPEGLMQTVIGTFNAHALPGHKDIWNPVDNAAAAIRYIIGRYGDPSRTPGLRSMASGHGYTNYGEGGIRFGVYDNGGILPPGLTVAYNGTRHNETVSTGPAVSADAIEFAVNRAVQSAVRELRERDRSAAPIIIDHPTPIHVQHLADEIAWSRR
jgi:TP901 family phage tail tape measure protein